MTNISPDSDVMLDSIATRRLTTQRLISARRNHMSGQIEDRHSYCIRHLLNVDSHFERAESFFRRLAPPYFPHCHQPFICSLVCATACESRNCKNCRGEVVATEADNSNPALVSSGSGYCGDGAENANEPEVLSSPTEDELHLLPPLILEYDTETLRGAHCGRFGTTNTQSIVAYGPRHLSSWSCTGSYKQTNLTGYLPRGTIDSVAPLSQNVLGIVANLKKSHFGPRDGEIVLFDIDAAVNHETLNAPPYRIWSDISTYEEQVSIIKGMNIDDDTTFFLSDELHSNEVMLHSYLYEDGNITNTWSRQLNARLNGRVSALCYDSKKDRAIAGTAHGRISVVNLLTGECVGGGRVFDRSDPNKDLKISNLAVCPSSPHLLLATCSSMTNQLKIFDLRASMFPVLSYGKPLVSEYPEEIVPAWNPYNWGIVAPYNRQQTGDEDDLLSVFDVRFAGLVEEGPREYQVIAGSSSVSFGTDQDVGFPIMVTARNDGTLGVFDYMDL